MVLALLRVRLAGSKLDDANPAVRAAVQFSCRPGAALCVVIKKKQQAKLARSFDLRLAGIRIAKFLGSITQRAHRAALRLAGTLRP